MIVLIFYILFLPAEEREKLLGEEETSTVTTTKLKSPVVLLSTDVGTLTQVKEKEIEHTLPPVLVEERSSAEVLAELNPFTVRRGWIREKKKQVTLTIEKHDVTENVFLNFQLAKHVGGLRIKLNMVEIFDGEIEEDVPQTILLKKELLQKINLLEFETYGFGLFAREYAFKDVKIVGDVVDKARKAAFETIVVSPEEHANVERGHLSFFAVCKREEVGVLEISLNGKTLAAGVPNCNSVNRFEFVKDDVKVGKNELLFALERGRVRLDSIVIKTKLKPTKSFIDYFNVNGTIMKKLDARQAKSIIKITFVDDNALKVADLNINGILSTIDQKTSMYEKDITSRTREGNNYVALTPRTELNVVNLQVKVE